MIRFKPGNVSQFVYIITISNKTKFFEGKNKSRKYLKYFMYYKPSSSKMEYN